MIKTTYKIKQNNLIGLTVSEGYSPCWWRQNRRELILITRKQEGHWEWPSNPPLCTSPPTGAHFVFLARQFHQLFTPVSPWPFSFQSAHFPHCPHPSAQVCIGSDTCVKNAAWSFVISFGETPAERHRDAVASQVTCKTDTEPGSTFLTWLCLS